jgi:hypothetical protein
MEWKRCKHGELLGIPERFVIAMGDAGFYRIDSVIWAKESVRIDGIRRLLGRARRRK